MPKYYCEYCDINLTHSSPAGRRQHNSGRRHINNKIEYYQQLLRMPDFVPPAHIAVSRNLAFVNPATRFPTIMRPNMLARPPPGTTFVPGGPMGPEGMGGGYMPPPTFMPQHPGGGLPPMMPPTILPPMPARGGFGDAPGFHC